MKDWQITSDSVNDGASIFILHGYNYSSFIYLTYFSLIYCVLFLCFSSTSPSLSNESVVTSINKCPLYRYTILELFVSSLISLPFAASFHLSLLSQFHPPRVSTFPFLELLLASFSPGLPRWITWSYLMTLHVRPDWSWTTFDSISNAEDLQGLSPSTRNILTYNQR